MKELTGHCCSSPRVFYGEPNSMDILLGRTVGELGELLLTLYLLSLLKLGYVELAALSTKYSEQRWVLPKVVSSLKNI